jgi:hypothetical protein
LRVLLAEALFTGTDLVLLVLALGAALVVGNGYALVRPPTRTKEGELSRAPFARSLVMIVIGLVATIWAVATLTS